jgi:hypothetical protein
MAVLNKYTFLTEEVIFPVTLTASDTAVVSLNKKSALIVENSTGGPLTINIKGDTATSKVCEGIGSVDLTGGKPFSIADTETKKFPLNATYQAWLGDGNVTITGGTGATAYILEV